MVTRANLGSVHGEHEMRRNREAGQALYLTAMSLIVVVGLLGFGIDMGTLRYEKRLQQTAADAAAIAGASNLPLDGSGSAGVIYGAKNASATNGFTDSGTDCTASAAVGTVCVQVNSPPQDSEKHNGDNNSVEVLVSAVHPTYFVRIFGVTKETVTARAVATNVSSGPNTPCLLALNTSVSALSINGTINASLCSIITNGEIQINGRVSSATSIGAGECRGSCSNVVTGISAMADPVASLTTPPPDGCSGGGLLGLLLNFCRGTIGGGDLSLSSGLYVLTNGLSVQPGATLNLLNAAGTTIYIPNGTINVGAGATLNAPGVTIVTQSATVSGVLNLSIGSSGSSIKNAVLVE